MPAKAYKGHNQNKGSNRRSKNRLGAIHKKSFSWVPVDRSSTSTSASTWDEICIFESNTPVPFEDVLSSMETNTNLAIKASPIVRGTVISSMKQIVGKVENPIRPLVKVVIKATPPHRVFTRARGNVRREDKLTSRGELIVHVKSPIVKNEENNISFLKEVRVNRPSRRRGFGSSFGVPDTPELVQVSPHDDRDVEQQEIRKKIKENFEISSTLAIKLKKSLVDDSQLKKLSVDKVNKFFHRTFFEALGFYQASIEMDGIKKYYVYKNNEFDFYIDMLISKEFPIKIGSKQKIYNLLYEELYSFLQNGDIRIGEFGQLIGEKENIIIEITENLQPLDKIVPAKSKKLQFKK